MVSKSATICWSGGFVLSLLETAFAIGLLVPVRYSLSIVTRREVSLVQFTIKITNEKGSRYSIFPRDN